MRRKWNVWGWFEMVRAIRISNLAKKLGFRSARDKNFRRLITKMSEIGLIRVQQSGFKAHSSCHPKIVAFKSEPNNQPSEHKESHKGPSLSFNVWCDECKKYHSLDDLIEDFREKCILYRCPKSRYILAYIS